MRKVVDFFDTRMMLANFRQAGMVDCVRERLKIVVKTCESCAAQVLSTFLKTPSGPEAFLGYTLLSIHSTSCAYTVSGWELEAGWGWGGVAADC